MRLNRVGIAPGSDPSLPVPDIVKSDPFWLKEDPRRAVYVQETLLGPTMPFYEVYNPANAQANASISVNQHGSATPPESEINL